MFNKKDKEIEKMISARLDKEVKSLIKAEFDNIKEAVAKNVDDYITNQLETFKNDFKEQVENSQGQTTQNTVNDNDIISDQEIENDITFNIFD